MDTISVAKYLVSCGIFLLLIGSVLFFLGKLGIGLGKLPGDIIIQKENSTFYFPLATSIIVSLLLTVIINLISKK